MIDRDEKTELWLFARKRDLSTAALFRIAMNYMVEKECFPISLLEVRDKRGRPRKS